ncbi:MAG: copper amine oxidase N-terminal domain-containing protein [Clostridia bacterium]
MKKNILAGCLAFTILLNALQPVFAETIISDTSATSDSSIIVGPIINSESNTISGTAISSDSSITTDGALLDDAISKIIFTLNSKVALIDGKSVKLLLPPKLIQGRTLLPLRIAVENILKAQVLWNSKTKTITITKDANTIILRIGNRTALVNGVAILLDVAPILEYGTTLLPIRFLAEQMGILIEFDAVTKKIYLTGSLLAANKIPDASFYFPQAFVAGQAVTAVDTSMDSDGDAITAREWMINLNPKQKNAQLSTIFSYPNAGTYAISLKVKDSKGAWSNWYTEYLTIAPNQPPIVTAINVPQESFKRGEEILYDFSFDNESWETIKAVKWSYYLTKDLLSQPIYAKPSRIFDAGEYTVTLQLQDAYGNWSDKFNKQIVINSELLFTEFAYKFNFAAPGETIANFSGYNFMDYIDTMKESMDIGKGLLYMSNSPERVITNGMLYKDKVTGTGRAIIHHINSFISEDALEKRLVIVAVNQSTSAQNLTISNSTILGPTSDVLHLGQQLLYRYLQGSPSTSYILHPNDVQILYDSNGKKWENGTAISGLFDFTTSGETTLIVGCIDQSNSISDLFNMTYPLRDVHPRGSFTDLNQNILVNLTNLTEPSKLVLGKTSDEWISGYDGINGELVVNRGNYGMEYHISVTAKERTAVILNPRGNVYNGAIKWNDSTPFLAPSDGYFFGGKDRASFLGIIEAGQTRDFTYMLPNGSASPILFAFIPDTYW